jgi:hypothetical protein
LQLHCRGTAVASEARAEVAEPLCLQIQQYALDCWTSAFGICGASRALSPS